MLCKECDGRGLPSRRHHSQKGKRKSNWRILGALTGVIKNDDGELFYEYIKVSDEVRNLPELTCCACRHSGMTDISSGICDLDGVSYFGYKEACDLFTYRVVYESVKR